MIASRYVYNGNTRLPLSRLRRRRSQFPIVFIPGMTDIADDYLVS